MVTQKGSPVFKPSESSSAQSFKSSTGRSASTIGGSPSSFQFPSSSPSFLAPTGGGGGTSGGGSGGVKVFVSGNLVRLDGVDFSISPENQIAFIEKQGGVVSRNLRSRISQTTKESSILKAKSVKAQVSSQESLQPQKAVGTIKSQLDTTQEDFEFGSATPSFLAPTGGRSVKGDDTPSIEQPSAIGLPPDSVTSVKPPRKKFDKERIKKAVGEFFFVDGTPITAVGTLLEPVLDPIKGDLFFADGQRVSRLQAFAIEKTGADVDVVKVDPDVQKVGEAIGIAGTLGFGGSLGSLAVGSSSVAEGVPDLSKGILGENLSTKERAKFIGFGGLETGIGLLIGGGGVVQAGKVATQAEISEAVKQASLKQKGVRIKADGKVIDVVRGRASGEALADIQSLSVSKLIDNKFIQTGGKRVTTVVGQDIFSGKQIGKIISEDFTGQIGVLPSDIKGFTTGIGKGSIIKTSEFSFIPKKAGLEIDFKSFKFKPSGIKEDVISGFSIKKNDFIFGAGGRIERITAETTRGQGFEFLDGFRFKTPIESRTILREFAPVSKDKGFTLIQGTGKKTPFSTTFAETKQTSFPVISDSFKIPKIDVGVSGGSESSLIGIPRSIDTGKGLTELQITSARGDGLTTQGFVDTGSFTKTNFGVIQSGGQQTLQTQVKDLGVLVNLQSPSLDIKGRQVEKQLFKTSNILKDIQSPLTQQKQISKQKQGQLQAQTSKLIQQQQQLNPKGFGSGRFRGFPNFGLPPVFGFPPLLSGSGRRGKPLKRKRARVPIRPSFTGIILNIEQPALISPTLGVLPGQIRGLATGFDTPKRKKGSKRKRQRNIFSSFTNL